MLILEISRPATSYVAATFHQTISQRAHQSLSKTTTPELGMIPQGIKNTRRLPQIQGYNKTQPSQHSWVYQTYTGSDLHIAKVYTNHIQANIWVY